jgi:hypothetical protein
MGRRLLTLLFLLLPGPALATVFIPADFTQIVTESRAIIHGRIVDVRARTTGDRRSIETLVTLAAVEHLKGNLGSTVTFKVPGGQVGRYRRVLVGAPVFEPGDDVIVFLTARGPSIPYLYGLSQGVYHIARAADGREVVTPPPVMARGVGAERVVRGDPARRPLPVDEFARKVREVLERSR